jgi:hypothetical protein
VCLVTAPGLEGDLKATEEAASAAEEEAAAVAAAADEGKSASSSKNKAAKVVKAPVLEVRAAGVDRTRKASEGDVVPIDLALNGARRWVVAVDRACVRRVAVTPGTFGSGKKAGLPPLPGLRYQLHGLHRLSPNYCKQNNVSEKCLLSNPI